MITLSDNRVLVPLTLALFLLGVALSPISYHTLDEVILRSLLQGSFLGYQDVDQLHTLFPNVIYSTTIAWLYQQAPGFYWYDIVTMGCNLLALAAALWASVDGTQSQGERLFRVLAVSLVSYPLFVNPQFTLTAGFLGVSAMALAVKASRDESIRTIPVVYVFCALILCGLIRHPVLQLVLLAGGLVFLPTFCAMLRRRHRPALILLATILLSAVTSYALQHLDRTHYRGDAELNDSLRLGAASRSVRNYAVTNPSEAVQDEVARRLAERGISESTLFALRSAYYFDSDLKNPQAAEIISEEVGPLLSRRNNLRQSLRAFFSHAYHRIEGLLAQPVLQLFHLPVAKKLESTRIALCLIVLGLLTWGLGWRRQLMPLVYGCLVVSTVYIAIAILLRIPPFRIYYLLFLIVALSLLISRNQNPDYPGNPMPWRVLLAGFTLLALGINQVSAMIRSGHANIKQHERIAAVVNQLDHRYVYLMETGFLDHYLLPFHSDPATVGLRAFSGGWHAVLPWYRKMLTDYQVGGEIESLCNSPRIRLVPPVRRSFHYGRLLEYLRLSAMERPQTEVTYHKSARANRHPVIACELVRAP